MFDPAVVHGASDLHVERHESCVMIVRSRDGEVLLRLTPRAAQNLARVMGSEYAQWLGEDEDSP